MAQHTESYFQVHFSNINALMVAVQKTDKLMHHRAKATTVTIK